MKPKLPRRLLCGIGAAAVALSMLIGGAFAWADNSQHKTNAVAGGGQGEANDVVLVEDYEEPPDWLEDEALKKEIWARNTGGGPIFVRLQLKEYMDVAAAAYTYSDEFLLVDSDGKFVAADTLEALKAWLDENGVPYTDDQFKRYTAYGGDAERFYFATGETTTINGKYGKKLLLGYAQGAPASLVPGVARGVYENTGDHWSHPTGECLYTPHLWDGSADPFREYVEWGMGAPLVKLSDWDGQPVAAWILDDSSANKAEGWVYWGEALRPGDSTAKLLETITLAKQPAGPFYYAIHVDMQAADLYQLKAEFTGMPDKVNDSYRGTA